MGTVFLFGSGADSDCAEELKSGQSFSEALLRGDNKSEAAALLGDQYANFQIIYPSSTKVFVQTVATFSEKAKGVLDDCDIENCKKYYFDKKAVIFQDCIQPACAKWYKTLKSDSEEDKHIREFFFQNAVFFDALDEKFNSLRHKEHNDSAKRVINAYVMLFVFMLKSLYNLTSFTWSFENVFEKLRCDYEIERKSESYYQLLKDSQIECEVITTNYTELAEKETGKDAIYLHGRLTWFEDLQDLSVYDCMVSDDKRHLLEANSIIPFILIPSGVKPLICTRQIQQFAAFIDKLNESNELCVIGYKFNSEDNHINSIIAEWMRKDNHRLVYFNYNNHIDFAGLGWATTFSVNTIDFATEKAIKMTEDKIQNIVMCKENSHDAFKEYLKARQEK